MDPVRRLLFHIYQLNNENVTNLLEKAKSLLDLQNDDEYVKALNSLLNEDFDKIKDKLSVGKIPTIKMAKTIIEHRLGEDIHLHTAKKVVDHIIKVF